jgi:Glycogen recognition site of AMP-activated protein kinase
VWRPVCSVLLSIVAVCGASGVTRLAGAAPRASADLDVLAGGGYDTNLFLLVAADPDSPTYHPYRGWFARLAPSAVAAMFGEDWRFELRLGADLRQTAGSGALFMEDAQLGLLRPELGPIDLRVGLTGGRFDATVDEKLRFTSAGGVARVTWRLQDRWSALGTYKLARRWFGAAEQLGLDGDLTQDGELRMVFAPGPRGEVAGSVDYLDLRSSPTVAAATGSGGVSGDLTRASAGLDGSAVVASRTSLSASIWAGILRTGGVSSDLQVGGAAAVSVRLLDDLEAVVRYELLVDRRREGSAGLPPFDRQAVLVALVARAVSVPGAATRGSRHGSATGLSEPESDSDAVELSGGQIRFRLRAPPHAKVNVIGSWNDWAYGAEGQRLTPGREAGTWEVRVKVPPGRHSYRFVVDGKPVPPPAGARTRPDGFGGADEIIEVSP